MISKFKNTEKKYELTDETKTIPNGTILHRIRAVRSFGDVHKGDLGGFIESEYNLSHDGNCWVYGGAYVCDNARVQDNATVYGTAKIREDVTICGDAIISENVSIAGYAIISGNAKIHGNPLRDTVLIAGGSRIYGNAVIDGYGIRLCGHGDIGTDALIRTNDDYLIVDNIGFKRKPATFYNCKDGMIRVYCECYYKILTLDEFVKLVKETYGNNSFAKEYMAAMELAKIKLTRNEYGLDTMEANMEKKYELTDKTKTLSDGVVIYRIRALKDFGEVKAGAYGGFIETEDNLSHDGDCWVYDDAIICSNAHVSGNTYIAGNAVVCGHASISEHASVFGNAHVNNNAKIYGNASVCGYGYVYGNVTIRDDALIKDNATISEYANIFGDARVLGAATVSGHTQICGDDIICGNTVIGRYRKDN